MKASELKGIEGLVVYDKSSIGDSRKRRLDLSRLPIYLEVINIVVGLFFEVFVKDGKVRIRLWDVIGNVGKVIRAFRSIQSELDKIKQDGKD